MLKLNENQVDVLLDALGFGVIYWDDLMNPELTTKRRHCADLEEKVENQHTIFSSNDIQLMIEALQLLLDDGEDLTPEYVIVKNILLQHKDSSHLTILFVS